MIFCHLTIIYRITISRYLIFRTWGTQTTIPCTDWINSPFLFVSPIGKGWCSNHLYHGKVWLSICRQWMEATEWSDFNNFEGENQGSSELSQTDSAGKGSVGFSHHEELVQPKKLFLLHLSGWMIRQGVKLSLSQSVFYDIRSSSRQITTWEGWHIS